MKTLLLITSLFFISQSTPQGHREDPALPELHKILKITLSPSYGCRSKEDFQKGYGNTGLFLSRNSSGPDLLFDGACGSPDWLEGSTGGDDMSVIADLGKIRLEDLRADQVFNVQRLHAPELYSRFVRTLPVEIGHTYALLINRRDVRGFVYFTVTGYIPNERLDLRYTVKHYQRVMVRAESSGFDWAQKSQ
jgi:hypothetical protein